jgi:TatD DNase family protein
MLIDSHAHLYLEQFDPDRAAMVHRALDQGVKYMLLPHIDSETTAAMLQLSRQFPLHCIPMMGLHPTSVKEDFTDEVAHVEKELTTGKYCAVGEVGIDLYWDTTFQKQQQEVFLREIELAEQYHMPLVVHTRNSLEETIEIIRKAHHQDFLKSGKPDPKITENTILNNISTSSHQHISTLTRGVFHCFPGNVEQAREVINLGYYLGIGGVVTYKNSLMAKVVETIPLEYLLLETDAPFLTPHPKRGTRNESAYLTLIAKKIAEIKGISFEEVAETTSANAVSLFKL